jgi:hypothetical protein
MLPSLARPLTASCCRSRHRYVDRRRQMLPLRAVEPVEPSRTTRYLLNHRHRAVSSSTIRPMAADRQNMMAGNRCRATAHQAPAANRRARPRVTATGRSRSLALIRWICPRAAHRAKAYSETAAPRLAHFRTGSWVFQSSNTSERTIPR